jgi:hypothetical protein
MDRSLEVRVRDVMRLVHAARSTARDDTVIDALVRSTGLSREGVVLGLTEHLETDPAEAEVRTLVETSGSATHVHVILSANVFVAPLRALAVARAAAPRVTVSPSSRDPVLANALLERANDPGLVLAGEVPADADEVHVYGRDETLAEVRAIVPSAVRVRGHGAGFGVACVSGRAPAGDAAAAIARDVVVFDQRGCLSPRIVLSFGTGSQAEALGAELDRALSRVEAEVPRGRLEPEEREASARYVAAMEFAGRAWKGSTHVVGLAPDGTPLWVPPTGRHVHVAVVRDRREAHELLSTVGRFVTAIGTDESGLGEGLVDHRVRLSENGCMQKPPFDGPVDVRTPG